jgi:hypothetical protein
MSTPREKLEAAVRSVDWKAHAEQFLNDAGFTEVLAKCQLRLAIWARQLEASDVGNPALAFVREMQASYYHVTALVALALYKPAAAAIRTMFESVLYYTYFRTHPVELATLVRNSGYYVQKSEIVDYHMQHTPKFNDLQNLTGLVGRITDWYKYVSSIVHGQIPGDWITHTAFAQLKPVRALQEEVVKSFLEGEAIIHDLLLCTVGQELWNDFASSAKRALLAGLRGDVKIGLGLDVS